MERRQSERINLSLRCHVKIGENGGEITLAETENVSRTGLMLRLADNHTPSAPAIKPGQYLEVYVELPRAQDQPPRSLCCKATVVRRLTDPAGNLMLGLSVQQMSFRDLPGRFNRLPAHPALRNRAVM